MFFLLKMQPTNNFLFSHVLQCFWIYFCQKTSESALDDSGIENV